MRRLLLALLTGIVVVGLAWVLAGISGQVAVSVGSYQIATSVPIAILALIVLVVLLMLVLRLIVGIWLIPGSTRRWRRGQRFRVGQRSLNRVLVALAAGDQSTARKSAHRARRLLGDTPQTLLLVAEAERLGGREDQAEEAFRALTKQKDAQFLGYRGLLRQAIEREDWSAAQAIARQAETAYPNTAWLRRQRADLALRTDNWADALELIGSDPRRAVYNIAAADAEPNPRRALEYARQAWKEDPTFAPATLAYARRLRETGYESRARSTIQEAWGKAPHPDLAAFYLENQTDKVARLQAAKHLVERNPANAESRLLVAQAALDAGLTAEARAQIEAAQAEGVNQRRLCMLVADLEEQEHGDTEAGRQAQRAALRAAATAHPDPHWQCSNCYAEPASWQPKCPVCEHVGTLRWVAAARPRSQVPAVITSPAA